MKKYCLLSTVFILVFVPLWCGAQTITVSAPTQVAAGEKFRVSYTITTQDVSDFKSGIHSTEEAEIIAGPYTSSQSSFQMVNGHTTSSSTVTYTYTLYAAKNGTFNIPAAQAVAGGKTIQSKPYKVNIVGTANANGGTPNMHQDD